MEIKLEIGPNLRCALQDIACIASRSGSALAYEALGIDFTKIVELVLHHKKTVIESHTTAKKYSVTLEEEDN